MIQWGKIQKIGKGVVLAPMRDDSLNEEWVLRSEAEDKINYLKEQLELVQQDPYMRK